MLKKAFRLPAATSLTDARILHTNCAIIKIKKNNLDKSRFGFVVSKKISKSAVVRNSIKRQIRRCIEGKFAEIAPGYDMLLFTKRNIANAEKIDCKSLIESIKKNT
jgi:ribonuclease P protein component